MPITQLSAISITDETVYRIGQLLSKLMRSRKFQNMMYRVKLIKYQGNNMTPAHISAVSEECRS